jgi:hypothetical protein
MFRYRELQERHQVRVVDTNQVGATVARLTMASDRQYPGSEHPWMPSYRDIPLHIGQALRKHYELPEELPHQLLTLLMQINDDEDVRSQRLEWGKTRGRI